MERFGKYEILEPLAVGGMAEIFLARSRAAGGVDQTYAIKRILPSYSADLTFVSMFIDEARISIGLEHPNVVRLFDFGQAEGAYFMAMEYVDGTDLASLLKARIARGLALPPAAAAFVVGEICRGLAHAHDKHDHRGLPLGIVHRDVSPQNVLLSKAGEVKLTDFGIAAARNKLTLTTPGTVLGKSAYMAPEQALGEKVDRRCDLWAAGVILYELLTGERLFAASSPVASVAKVLRGLEAPPSARRPEVPKALDDVVVRALQKRPDARFPDAGAMAKALDAWLEDAGGYRNEDLARLLAGVEWTDDTAGMRKTLETRKVPVSPDASTVARGAVEDPRVAALFDALEQEPDLWTLVAIGEQLEEIGETPRALAAFRAAAACFAYQGLLVQALCAYDRCVPLVLPPEAFEDRMALGDLAPGARDELEALIARFKADELFRLLLRADPKSFAAGAEVAPPATPLLGHLAPRELAQLAERARVRRVEVGAVLLEEGEPGNSLFALGRGRVLVHCAPGAVDEELPFGTDLEPSDETYVEGASPRTGSVKENTRVYLSSLSAGDFFGEFSFLTERPRSASVEAITACEVLEIDRAAVEQILAEEPGFTAPLLGFYKERVVELMMAKSPVFSRISPTDRRALLARASLETARDQEIVVEEGQASDSLFFIKQGEVEVFHADEGGTPIFINKLGQGQFFGEISALRGTPRTVSVRAMGEVTLLRIARTELADVLAREPRLLRLLEDTIASRTADLEARVREFRRIFYPT